MLLLIQGDLKVVVPLDCNINALQRIPGVQCQRGR